MILAFKHVVAALCRGGCVPAECKQMSMMMANLGAEPISTMTARESMPTILAVNLGGGEGEFAASNPPATNSSMPEMLPTPSNESLGEVEIKYINHSTPQTTKSAPQECTADVTSTNGG